LRRARARAGFSRGLPIHHVSNYKHAL
jgi:hypothetical protein